MARIAGVNIPTAKRVEIALRYINGIGPNNAKVICGEVKIPAAKRVNELTDAEVLAIREIIDRDYTVVHRWFGLPQPRQSRRNIERWYGSLSARQASKGVLDLALT